MYRCFYSALIKWLLRFHNEGSEELSVLCNGLFQFCLLTEISLFNFSHWLVTFTMKNLNRYLAGQSQSQINIVVQFCLWLYSLRRESAWIECLIWEAAQFPMCLEPKANSEKITANHLTVFLAVQEKEGLWLQPHLQWIAVVNLLDCCAIMSAGRLAFCDHRNTYIPSS